MAESENTYVKIGERGLLIERIATEPRDHVNLRSTGWVLKGAKGAPTKKDAWGEEPDLSGLSDAEPTSVKAATEAADAVQATASRPKAAGRGSSSAGEAADAKSQAAAS